MVVAFEVGQRICTCLNLVVLIRKMFCQYGNNVRFADSFVIPGLRETDIQRQMEGKGVY